MKSKLGIVFNVLIAVFLIILGSVSCGSAEEPTPEPVVKTPAAAPDTPTPIGQAVEKPTATTEPEPEPADELESPKEAVAVTLVNLNVREGPGTGYPKVGKLPQNTEVAIIGQNDDGSWLMVRTGLGEVWISGDPELVQVDSARLADVPLLNAPPLPYDAGNPQVQELLNKIPLVVHHDGNQTCASNGGLNNLLPEVADGHVIGPHSGDFVMGNDNVLFKYTNGRFILIRENPVARFENGEESLSFADAMNLFAGGDILWNGSFGDWPARGVTGCDPAASQ